MRFVVEVGNQDGSCSVLSRGEHGQARKELEVLAERWRASLLFGNANIRVVQDRPERRAAVPVARAEVVFGEMAESFLMTITTVLQPPPLNSVPEEPLDDSPAEVRLAAVLHVHAAELLACSGRVTEELRRDGEMSVFLWRDIERAIERLKDALATYAEETA